MRYWNVYCMEDRYPGLWHTWFKHQVVAVGWAGKWGFLLDGGGKKDSAWSKARVCLRRMCVGDRLAVQLRNHRIGRIGGIVKLEVDDDSWNPTVPVSSEEPHGEQGRRVLVRWDLANGPTSPDLVVELPPDSRLGPGRLRSTVCELEEDAFESIESEMGDEENWVSILPQFAYERSLADYIASFPYRLEDGLRPFPSEKAREYVFGDRSRADVLLLDRKENLVVVECKQSGPTVADVRQLCGYMKRAGHLTKAKVRGVLVHGGARKLPEEVRCESSKASRVELLQYSISVGFLPSA